MGDTYVDYGDMARRRSDEACLSWICTNLDGCRDGDKSWNDGPT